MKSRPCVQCAGEMPLRARADARYCSSRCRVAAHRSRGFPAELRALPRWVRYSRKKVPLTAGGDIASSTNPNTWTDYSRAVASTAGVGLGFVLAGDGIVCLDLDDCLDDQQRPNAAAAELLALAGPTYIEVSPSGRGLHIWGHAALDAGRVVPFRDQTVEMYPSGRFITVTKSQFTGSRSRLADLSAVITALL